MFTRTKHRANRLADVSWRGTASSAERIHGNRIAGAAHRRRSPASRPAATAVLVATDIAARGIDVEALGHVVNFDVPHAPDDYIHRVGRTGARRGDRRRLHLRRAARRRTICARIERADRQAPAARHAARLRLREAAGRAASRCRSASVIAAIRARKADERARAQPRALGDSPGIPEQRRPAAPAPRPARPRRGGASAGRDRSGPGRQIDRFSA